MTKKQQKVEKTPAQVLPLKPGEVADEGLFRKSLRDMEENNRRFFGDKKKGAGKPPAPRFVMGDGPEDDINIKKGNADD